MPDPGLKAEMAYNIQAALPPTLVPDTDAKKSDWSFSGWLSGFLSKFTAKFNSNASRASSQTEKEITKTEIKQTSIDSWRALFSFDKPDVSIRDADSFYQRREWNGTESTCKEFSTALEKHVEEHFIKAKEQQPQLEEQKSQFELDAGRGFSYETTLKDKTIITSADKKSEKANKIEQAHAVLTAIVNETIEGKESDSTVTTAREHLKKSLEALSNQSISGILMTLENLPENAGIIGGHPTAMKFSYTSITPKKIEIKIHAVFSRSTSNTLLYGTGDNRASFGSEDYKKGGSTSYTLQVNVNDDGTIASITCPSLNGSWDMLEAKYG